jgi:poly-gamma-glutamate capsule biosynthesis protein CapA/YwtB (metallophosphatase superfamily)
MATPAPRPRRRRITVGWAGDTTLGSDRGLPAGNGWQLLAPVARSLRAPDLMAVNHEGTLATNGTSKCGARPSPHCFAFRAPPANAGALRRAGVDVANLANNHAFDFGAVGMGETVRALERRRVAVTGRPGEILLERVRGVRIAMLGFSTYPWSSPMNDPAAVRDLVRLAARRADVVIAFFHAGAEGTGHEHTPPGREHHLGEDRGDVRAFARAAIAAGADLVLGSGPHVLRGIELHRGRLVAYSLGNLAGYKTFSSRGTMAFSGVLHVTIDRHGRFVRGRLRSLVLDGDGIPGADRERRAAALVSGVGREDFGAAALVVDGEGRLRPARRDGEGRSRPARRDGEGRSRPARRDGV